MKHPAAALRTLATISAVAVLSCACSTDGDGAAATCNVSGAGTLTVTLVGLPSGVSGKVTVVGPAGTQTASASQTFAATAGGKYSVTADKVVQADPLVRTVFAAKVAPGSACVTGGATQTVTVTYAPIATSNKIWVAASNAPTGANSHGFSAAQLATTATVEATVATKSGAGRRHAFDRAGNLWAVGGTTADPAVLRLPAAAFAATGPLTPDRKVDIVGLGCTPATSALAFDKAGALWVASECGNAIFKLSPAQLAASGSVVPSVKLTVGSPGGMALDASGNLWVAADGKLARFDAAVLSESAAAPSVVLRPLTKAVGGGELHPGALAFDASGNLWTHDFGGNVLFHIPAADLAAVTAKDVVPPALVTVGVGAILGGLAFDEGGGLWTTYAQGKFARLAPPQLTVSTDAGSPTVPERVISSANLGYSEDIALYPAATGVPLYAAMPE